MLSFGHWEGWGCTAWNCVSARHHRLKAAQNSWLQFCGFPAVSPGGRDSEEQVTWIWRPCARRVSSLKNFKAWKLQRKIIGKYSALVMFASLDLKTVIAFSQIEKIGFSDAINSLLSMLCVLDLPFSVCLPLTLQRLSTKQN